MLSWVFIVVIDDVFVAGAPKRNFLTERSPDNLGENGRTRRLTPHRS